MKVFTDETETSFFATDNYIKNLHEIEINSVRDFVFKYALDEDIVLGHDSWMIGRFDELTSGNPSLDNSDEPSLHGDWLDLDFISEMSIFEIIIELIDIIDLSVTDICLIPGLFMQEMSRHTGDAAAFSCGVLDGFLVLCIDSEEIVLSGKIIKDLQDFDKYSNI